MSTSSLKSEGSLLTNWGTRLVETLGMTIPSPSPMRWTLSIHWEMSVIQAAFSCLVGATRWSVVSWPDLTASICILKSRLWYSAFPVPLPLLRSLRLLALLRLEDSEDSEERRDEEGGGHSGQTSDSPSSILSSSLGSSMRLTSAREILPTPSTRCNLYSIKI